MRDRTAAQTGAADALRLVFDFTVTTATATPRRSTPAPSRWTSSTTGRWQASRASSVGHRAGRDGRHFAAQGGHGTLVLAAGGDGAAVTQVAYRFANPPATALDMDAPAASRRSRRAACRSR
jgi:hypothetical protein